MRLRVITGEAVRNITSGTTRTVVFATILSSVLACLVLADLTTSESLVADAVKFQKSGASIITFSAPGRIDGDTCESLGAVPNVHSSGAIRSLDTGTKASALPSSTIPSFEVTAGFSELMGTKSSSASGAIISDAVADALGVSPGDEVQTANHGLAKVSGVYEYPSDGRRSGYGYAILSPVPDSGPFDECWIDVWPTIKEAPILLQTTLIPGGDKAEKAVLSQLNTSLGRAFDGNGKFLNRVTQFAPLAAVIIAFGIGFVSIRVRRIQLASAIHAGVSKLDLTILVTVETSSWVIPAGIFSAITATLFAASSTLGTSEATFVLALRVFGPALVAAVAGALVALGLTQEKHLFRYFKNR